VLAVGGLTLGLGFLGFAVMQQLWQMYLLVMLLGVSITALGDIAVGQLVTRFVDRGRGLALGIVYTGSNLGGWLVVPAAVAVASAESWRAAMAYLGASAWLVLLPAALLLVREPAATRGEATRDATDRPAAHAPDDASGDRDRAGARVGSDDDLDLAAALRTRSFWILFGALFSFFFFFLGVLDFLVLFLTDSGLSKRDASLYFSHGLGIGIAAKLILGATADRIPHKTAMLVDYGLLALSSLWLLALPDAAPIWGFVLCFAFATAARDVVYPLVIVDCFGPRCMAQIYGALMLALLPGGSLGPIFAAAIHDRFGSYRIAFYGFAALNLLAFAALGLIRRERSPRRG
jgi:sugar phosphate permease